MIFIYEESDKLNNKKITNFELIYINIVILTKTFISSLKVFILCQHYICFQLNLEISHIEGRL